MHPPSPRACTHTSDSATHIILLTHHTHLAPPIHHSSHPPLPTRLTPPTYLFFPPLTSTSSHVSTHTIPASCLTRLHISPTWPHPHATPRTHRYPHSAPLPLHPPRLFHPHLPLPTHHTPCIHPHVRRGHSPHRTDPPHATYTPHFTPPAHTSTHHYVTHRAHHTVPPLSHSTLTHISTHHYVTSPRPPLTHPSLTPRPH